MAKHLPPERRKGRHPLQDKPIQHHKPQKTQKHDTQPVSLISGGLDTAVYRTRGLPRSYRVATAALLFAFKELSPPESRHLFPLWVPSPNNMGHWEDPKVASFVEMLCQKEEATARRLRQFDRLYGETSCLTVYSEEAPLLLSPPRVVMTQSQLDLLRIGRQAGHRSQQIQLPFLRRNELRRLLVQMLQMPHLPEESEMQRVLPESPGQRLQYVWQFALAVNFRLQVEGLGAMFHSDSLYYPGLTAILVASGDNPPTEELLQAYAATSPDKLRAAERDVVFHRLAVLRDPYEFPWTLEMPWLVELIWEAYALPDIELVRDWKSSIPKMDLGH